ncbi:hypothetical protein ILUMI_19399 [Ignelater luminosus]|uniref:Uncharacterized protein n=1 Tax=Ignelater luminosus TaxID=2038154 RepID=A0A8K0CI94_IGNLU|nr:hypothetical protein ILUMI_19399 [Ignelater luminosus]
MTLKRFLNRLRILHFNDNKKCPKKGTGTYGKRHGGNPKTKTIRRRNEGRPQEAEANIWETKVLQSNLNRSRAATDLLQTTMQEHRIDRTKRKNEQTKEELDNNTIQGAFYRQEYGHQTLDGFSSAKRDQLHKEMQSGIEQFEDQSLTEIHIDDNVFNDNVLENNGPDSENNDNLVYEHTVDVPKDSETISDNAAENLKVKKGTNSKSNFNLEDTQESMVMEQEENVENASDEDIQQFMKFMRKELVTDGPSEVQYAANCNVCLENYAKVRVEVAAEIKRTSDPTPPLVVHWDGKLAPSPLEFEIDNEKLSIQIGHSWEDRLSILITSSTDQEQFLRIPTLPNGTGALISDVVYEALKEWNAQDKVRGMCFDTTASRCFHPGEIKKPNCEIPGVMHYAPWIVKAT